MNIYRYEQKEESFKSPGIFLAGPTVRGNQPHLTSWRFAAIEEFKKQEFGGSLIIPEFTSKTESDQHKDWIPLWEFERLKAADVILFWLPRTRELIGLTTNFEIGYWIAKCPEKIVYGRPDDAYRIDYVDIMWKTGSSDHIYSTLQETIEAAIRLAKNRNLI